MRMVEAGVQRQALAMAQAWQTYCQFLCGKQLCRQVELDNPFLVNVAPSKKRTADINEKEFKITLCHDLAETIGLSLLQGQFKVYYPFDNVVRVRVKGGKEFAKFQRMFTLRLSSSFRPWAELFQWPEGVYAG